jgi:ribosomal protein S19E (S16A)
MDVTETTKKKALTKDEIIQELMDMLKQNNMQSQSNYVFEICSYVDGLEKKLDAMTEELTNVRAQIKEMQEDTILKNLKESVSEAADRLENRCNIIKEQIFTVKDIILTKASDIVRETKLKGKVALNKVSEFFGVKKKLESIRENVKVSQVEVAGTIAKIDAFGKGMREANQQIANTFRTFADKETVDYSEKEKKFSKTEAVKKPWLAKKKLLEGMQLRLDAAIDKVDNLSRDVEIDGMMKQYDNLMEQAHERQNFATVAEPGEQYGADVFETANATELISKENETKDVKKPQPEKSR